VTTRARAVALLGAVMVGAVVVAAGCGDGDAKPSAEAIGSADGAAGTVAEATTDVPPTTVDPGTLPQTKDKPTTTSAQFQAGAESLWEAVRDDDVSKAEAFFFPLSAYKQVKNISNPESDYRSRLLTELKADVHDLHVKLGADASRAKFVGLDVPTAKATWMDPGTEYNKIGYWRVLDNKLRYTVDGNEKTLPVSSLISWRGEWYLVHLGAIR
jgi:hypothetical protein